MERQSYHEEVRIYNSNIFIILSPNVDENFQLGFPLSNFKILQSPLNIQKALVKFFSNSFYTI